MFYRYTTLEGNTDMIAVPALISYVGLRVLYGTLVSITQALHSVHRTVWFCNCELHPTAPYDHFILFIYFCPPIIYYLRPSILSPS